MWKLLVIAQTILATGAAGELFRHWWVARQNDWLLVLTYDHGGIGRDIEGAFIVSSLLVILFLGLLIIKSKP